MKAKCPKCGKEIKVYKTSDNSIAAFSCPECKVKLTGFIKQVAVLLEY